MDLNHLLGTELKTFLGWLPRGAMDLNRTMAQANGTGYRWLPRGAMDLNPRLYITSEPLLRVGSLVEPWI